MEATIGRAKDLLARYRSTYLPATGAKVRQKFPAGHFHSPIPDLRVVEARRDRLFDRKRVPAAITLRDEEQWARLLRVSDAVEALALDADGVAGGRYRFDNPMFDRGDAVALAGMLLLEAPRQFLEIGSGWSTAIALDVRDQYLPDLAVTCIEPNPQRLIDATGLPAESGITLFGQPLEEVDPGVFARLRSGDVLFVDSTHVVKVGSDVTTVIFDVLPSLPDGVLVHFHDVPWPFEYWEEWVLDGWGWTEAYLLHAFLMFNDAFEIVLWPNMLQRLDPARYDRAVPAADGGSGGSIWLRRRPG